MIAASKLKRAQSHAEASKPYVEKLSELSNILASKIQTQYSHPYMSPSTQSGRKLLVIFAPDRGLCGGLVTNLIREYLKFAQDENCFAITVGKKIEKYVARSKNTLIASFPLGTVTPTFDMIPPISTLIDQEYLSGKVSSVEVLSTRFTSVFVQKPLVSPLLPLTLSQVEEKNLNQFELFEPSVEMLIPPLLRRYMEMTLYQLLIENFVSEQASRMIAMQNATDNAKDIIEQLTLEYNKARQARITNEILDITSSSVAIYG